jgi:hypothetical protein
LHENGAGQNDKFLSTRFQTTDNYSRFFLMPELDGSYRIKVKANNRYWHENGYNDRLVSTRHQPNDDFTRFFLTK